MNSNKTGNPGKIIKKVLLVQLAWCEVRKLIKKIGTVTWRYIKTFNFLPNTM